MTREVFAVFDVPAKVYLNLWTSQNTATALRDFAGAVNLPESKFAQNADDFVLRRLGTWDDNTGIMTPVGEPVRVASAREVIRNV